MTLNQRDAPLHQALQKFIQNEPISFHVPGHKNGQLFSELGKDKFQELLKFDLTELNGLDDLHAPSGVIKAAQQLAADWFGASETHFLVGGSTAGNLAMILAAGSVRKKMIVQRNCHKSILNGLELCNAEPVFVAPEFDTRANRYTAPSFGSIKNAVEESEEIGAIILTYPDYYGKTFDIKEIIDYAHEQNIPVLVDEAHGVHFSLKNEFPPSALDLGADVVVQSAHKMAPAMTMASYLHVRSQLIRAEDVFHYLQMIQSSSPSYPLMASLDLARHFLANIDEKTIDKLKKSITQFREMLLLGHNWKVVESTTYDDPLKITLEVNNGMTGHQLAELFESNGIYPELSSYHQVLFVHGLAPFQKWKRLSIALEKIEERLNSTPKHDTMEIADMFPVKVQNLELSYLEMKQRDKVRLEWSQAESRIAAESVIPYPPGIPIIFKGEKITGKHVKMVEYLLNRGTNFQNKEIGKGIICFV
ncbi:aminotransferase class I/II-fold pyridoxal phosphate-dependent enzyme [Sediminibacillus massiliensis]|uniref:aminotransferase class I/II-fold pyridoxal phosphate-dependent enzyme n=1 Tax=Sediminibacillus massiliensis TaxID=1926277 RepID=UPI0009888D60|nr:aminotransferase class I/II-fold pyridoxal phosphate-dependent enzyme [Sediminibacillus massiliensis]